MSAADLANAERIFACVNFCAGVPSEDLKPGGHLALKQQIKDMEEMIASRNHDISERATDNLLLRREISLMRQREIEEGRLKLPQVYGGATNQ